MRNTKIWSIILAVITVVSLIIDTVDLTNILPFEVIGKISAVLTILKLIYDNRALFTASEVAEYANDNPSIKTLANGDYLRHNEQTVKNWRTFNK